jgi:hypothetical protein
VLALQDSLHPKRYCYRHSACVCSVCRAVSCRATRGSRGDRSLTGSRTR